MINGSNFIETLEHWDILDDNWLILVQSQCHYGGATELEKAAILNIIYQTPLHHKNNADELLAKKSVPDIYLPTGLRWSDLLVALHFRNRVGPVYFFFRSLILQNLTFRVPCILFTASSELFFGNLPKHALNTNFYVIFNTEKTGSMTLRRGGGGKKVHDWKKVVKCMKLGTMHLPFTQLSIPPSIWTGNSEKRSKKPVPFCSRKNLDQFPIIPPRTIFPPN